MHVKISTLMLLLNLGSLWAADEPVYCENIILCSECIKASCAWCSKPIRANETDVRCLPKSKVTSDWCPRVGNDEYLVQLENKIDVVENFELKPGTDGDAIQIKPQKIKLSLNLGEKIDIPLFYQQAEDYPIDLYFLMDLSNSMADDKQRLSSLGSQLSDMMYKMTNNFRLGFGSFVDKPIMPFTSPKLPCSCRGKPCANNSTCEMAYSYKNRMTLTKNTISFSDEVDKTPISGNMDAPEGGFDALMQVMVCKDAIGWRKDARKTVIFATDASFHLAGDGKLAGIVEPNDEECHLDETGLYTHSLEQDFPSISQLDKQARLNNINIIFAATNKDNYRELAENIQGAAAGVLEKDSKNIVKLVETEYKKILNSITLTDNADDHIKVEYRSACMGSKVMQSNKCDSLKGRPQIGFNVSITALDCPKDASKWSQTINIQLGAISESLTIELEINCRCPCEQEGRSTPKAAECHGSGNLTCGVCACDDGWYGNVCECNGLQASPYDSDSTVCRERGDNKQICSGQGVCKCGKCECARRGDPLERIYGAYCECDNFSCKMHQGRVCSGAERGRCDCGTCVCKSGWSGEACECRNTNSTCMAPGSSDVCSGNGDCVCGACRCNMTDNFRYSGTYCEECPHCTSNSCDELRHCVECLHHGGGKYDESECALRCDRNETRLVDKIDDVVEGEERLDRTERVCRVYDDAGCTIVFKYVNYDNGDKKVVEAQRIKECAIEINLLTVILGVIAAIVIGGLVLLIVWKISTTIHDSREYTRFVREKEQAKFDRGDNPLYQPSVTHFRNPTFNSN